MSNRAGRPRLDGVERYGNGRINHNKPTLAPAQLKRIKDVIVKQSTDARLDSQIGILLFENKLTAAQAAAAFRIGDIYRAWHRAKQRRVTTKSPNYDSGFGSADLAEERMSAEQLEAFEDRIRRAQAAWEKLDGEDGLFRRFLPPIRSALVDLCVLDRAISALILDDVRQVLDHLALRWKEHFSEQDRILRQRTKRDAVLLSSTADATEIRTQLPKHEDANLAALAEIAKKLRPDLDVGGLAEVRETFVALRDRHRFNSAKRRKH